LPQAETVRLLMRYSCAKALVDQGEFQSPFRSLYQVGEGLMRRSLASASVIPAGFLSGSWQ